MYKPIYVAMAMLVAIDCINGVPLAKDKKAIRKRQNDVNFLGFSSLPGETTMAVPTPAPTELPTTLRPVETAAPTIPPVETAAPTLAETAAPTIPPVETAAPTLAETAAPTIPPVETAAPTLAETAAPTILPVETAAPTIPPVETAAPTLAPTTLAPITSTLAAETTTPRIETPLVETSTAAIVSTLAPLPETTTWAHVESTLAPLPETSSEPALEGSTAVNPVRLVDSSIFACRPDHDPNTNYPSQKEACSHHFYACAGPNNQAYEFTCAVNMYFDKDLGEKGECHAFLDVPACTGSPRPTQPPTAAPTPKRPIARPDFDCSSQADGDYADPTSKPRPSCSSRYFSCNGGETFEMHCGNGLIFNRLSNGRGICDYEYRVFACTGQQWTEIVPTNPSPMPTLAPVKFDCSRRTDGDYADGCASHYITCSNGYPRLMQCGAPNLAFDPDTDKCLLRSEILICGGSKKTTPVPPPTPEIITVSTVKPDLDCYGKPDGDYRDPVNKCSRYFYKCAHNTTVLVPCAENLYYDPVLRRCENWITIFDCSGVSPTPAILTRPTPVPTFPTVDFDCSRRPDGQYANPLNDCSPFFYSCSNGIAFKSDCYEGLFYNPFNVIPQCESWMDVFGCSNTTRPPTTRAPITLPPTTQRPVYDCVGKGDGTFVDPLKSCSNIYYECAGGIAYRRQCLSLVWDDLKKECNHDWDTYACTGISPTPAPPSTPSTAVPTFPPVDFDCLSKIDGDYAELSTNCSSFYITCSSGYALRRPCPANQFFDPDARRCDHATYILACGGRPLSTYTGPSTTRRPKPVYPFDCTKRFNGLYPSGQCEPIYYSCVGGTTTAQLDCRTKDSPTLVFDDELEQCAFRFQVPKCGGTRPTPAPITSRRPVTPSIFDCSRKFDGNYQDPRNNCSQSFIQCSNGYTYVQQCGSGGLFYDEISDKCLHQAMVPACRGEGRPAATTVLPPNDLTSSLAPVVESSALPTILAESTSAAPAQETTSAAPAQETTSAAPAQETTSVAPAQSSALPLEPTTLIPGPQSTILAESTSALPIEPSSALPIEPSSALPIEPSSAAPSAITSTLAPPAAETTSAPQPSLPAETSSIEPASPPVPTTPIQ